MPCLRPDDALSVTLGSWWVEWVKEGGEGVGGHPEAVVEESDRDIGGWFSYLSGSAAVH